MNDYNFIVIFQMCALKVFGPSSRHLQIGCLKTKILALQKQFWYWCCNIVMCMMHGQSSTDSKQMFIYHR